ncbi:sugar kinase [Virgibacillus siamensis]|uniref:sugar kinase n=1 Tax=Virgibacillus siamensis TaxID=480071 RepID=UPI0009847D3E|nr:sugar kinase [Virgibacillus siamensis]
MANVITIGELMARFTPVHKKRLRDTQQFNVYYGGAEANVAMALSQYGHNVSFMTAFPENDLGDAAAKHLAGGGVDTSFVFRGGERLGTYYCEEGFSLKPANVIYDRKHSSIHSLPQMPIDWAGIYSGVEFLHITGITPALSSQLKMFTLEAVKQAKRHGTKVSFDCNFRSKLWTAAEAKATFQEILPYTDICFAGYKDFTALFGEDGPVEFNEKKLEDFYRLYAEKYNITVFASTGRTVKSATRNTLQGYLYQDQQLYKTECIPFEILDRIGGGDAFAAGVLHGILTNRTADETVQFGIASSILKHMVYGDHNQFTEDEVDAFLAGNMQDVNR